MSFNDLPSFGELPNFHNYPGCAWDVWGKGDELGTVNLLTDEVVKRAANEEIKSGKSVSLNWPINFPNKPVYNRKEPEHTIVTKFPGYPAYDDELHINTQSGTQWDGLRHFGILEQKVFYQGLPADSVKLGKSDIKDPLNVDPELVRLGIHNWAKHGICGRGVLIDLVKFYTESGTKPLPYDPWSPHSIPVKDIQAAAKKQGVEFRQADILLLRVGFMQRFSFCSQDERDNLAGGPDTFAGLQQSLEMKEFIWNNHFAAIASDQPALECWPPVEGEKYLHETIIGLFGMPIGEFFDLEKLSKVAEETGRYTFFFSSWPLNVLGGIASPPNAAAIF